MRPPIVVILTVCSTLIALSIGASIVRGTELYPRDDAYTDQTNPDDNYGSSSALIVRNRYGAGGEDGYGLNTFIRFGLPSNPPQILITSATLHLYYCGWSDNNPEGRPLCAYRVLADWNEDTITWRTEPPCSSEATDCVPVPPDTRVWMVWDVTSDVQAYLDGQVHNYGWKIADTAYWGQINIPTSRLCSKEYDHPWCRPYLEIQCDPELAFIRGDIDGSGSLDLGDGILCFRCQFLPSWQDSCRCDDALDTNDNGATSIGDCLRILRVQFVPGWQDSIYAPPFRPCHTAPQACGPDLSEDDLGCDEHPGCGNGPGKISSQKKSIVREPCH